MLHGLGHATHAISTSTPPALWASDGLHSPLDVFSSERRAGPKAQAQPRGARRPVSDLSDVHPRMMRHLGETMAMSLQSLLSERDSAAVLSHLSRMQNQPYWPTMREAYLVLFGETIEEAISSGLDRVSTILAMGMLRHPPAGETV